jgi:hypothetical protein
VGDIYDENKTCFTLEAITAVGRAPTGPGTGSPPGPTGPIVSTEPSEHAGGGTGGQAPCWNCSYGDPMLVCTAQVRRGDTVTCSSNITDELTTRVIRWRWADGSYLSFEETNPDMVWSGMAVHGGTVTLTIEEAHLRAGVLNQAFERGAELSNYSADHSNGASGNWSGVIWLYDPNSGSFVSANHTM